MTNVWARAIILSATVISLVMQSEVQAGEPGAVGDLYVCRYKQSGGWINQYDGQTGDFSCVFATKPPSIASPDKFQPRDLMWAPNGHLWVLSTPDGFEQDSVSTFVAEYDGQTGAFIRLIWRTSPTSFVSQSFSLGSSDGNLYQEKDDSTSSNNNIFLRISRLTGQNLGVAVSPAPPMNGPSIGRFTSDGKYIVLGNAYSAPYAPSPTVREYDASSFLWTKDLVTENSAVKCGILESPDGASYLITDDGLISTGSKSWVMKYNKTTGASEGFAVPRNPCLDSAPVTGDCDPQHCHYQAMYAPNDLAIGPNGHLFVSAGLTATLNPGSSNCATSVGAIHEFDLTTGEQIRMIGHTPDWAHINNTSYVREPTGLEFKPLPGDFGSSGSAFQGDWLVNEADLAKFTAAINGTSPAYHFIANLQSFDFNHDGVVDCSDWPPFAAAFLASSGHAPSLPLPIIEDFVAALLGTSANSCFADRNGDGKVDGLDVQPFIDEYIAP